MALCVPSRFLLCRYSCVLSRSSAFFFKKKNSSLHYSSPVLVHLLPVSSLFTTCLALPCPRPVCLGFFRTHTFPLFQLSTCSFALLALHLTFCYPVSYVLSSVCLCLCLCLWLKSLSLSLSLSSWGWQGRAESEKGLSSPVPDQQRSSSCVPVCFVGFPIAHLSFVCLNHGDGSLAPVSQIHAEQVVESELVSQLRPSYRRWIAKPCLDARFRATAVIREQPHFASTTESASWHTDAVCHFNGSATERSDSVPADWDQSGAAYSAYPGSVPASWEQ